MRWKYIKKEKKYPKEFEKRIRRIFLFFPKTIENETRWLEFSVIEESFYYGKSYIDPIDSYVNGWWNPIRWCN